MRKQRDNEMTVDTIVFGQGYFGATTVRFTCGCASMICKINRGMPLPGSSVVAAQTSDRWHGARGRLRSRRRSPVRLWRTFGERGRAGLDFRQRLALEYPFATDGTLVECQRRHDVGLAAICARPVTTNLLDLIAVTGRAPRDLQLHRLHKAFLDDTRKQCRSTRASSADLPVA
jgi:hypothetical protein